MNLILITPEKTGTDEITLANQMLDHGLDRLHIRKPYYSANDYIDYISQIAEQYRSKIVIHGHFELLSELKLGGIHLSEAMRKDPLVWGQIRDLPPSKTATSFHSWDEIMGNEFRYQYVFISPVFDSISKPGYKAGIGLEGARATKQNLASRNKYCPAIIGLGGVGPDQISILHQNGFDGAAMLGAIWDSKDPLAAFLQAKKVISELIDV